MENSAMILLLPYIKYVVYFICFLIALDLVVWVIKKVKLKCGAK